MSVYLTKEFARFARKAGLADAKLLRAAREVAAGRYDADLGGGVFKQRVAREGGGKSGGFRTIVLFRVGSDSFFCARLCKERQGERFAQRAASLEAVGGCAAGIFEDAA